MGKYVPSRCFAQGKWVELRLRKVNVRKVDPVEVAHGLAFRRGAQHFAVKSGGKWGIYGVRQATVPPQVLGSPPLLKVVDWPVATVEMWLMHRANR